MKHPCQHLQISHLSLYQTSKNSTRPTPDVDELFLLGDNGQADPNCVMIFGRDNHHNRVQDMDRVFTDGTFTPAPPLFSHVFVILAKRAEYVFYVMCALLPNKRQETYDGLFGLIKTIYGHFSIQCRSLATLRWQ